MVYDAIYNLFRRSPESIRKLATLVPIRYRLGGSDFAKEWEILQESEHWNKSKLQQLQSTRLESLLEHAVKNVPFYSDIELRHDDPFQNLKEFPVIDKETIQENKSAFQATNIPDHQTHQVTTGGTSGNPLRFQLDNSVYGREWAHIMTGWRRVGYSPGDKVVSFRGVEFPKSDEGIYWQLNPFYNAVEMSPFHINTETLPDYIEKIREVSPKFIHGYPSAIASLAQYLESQGIESFPSLKGVLAASENVYESQRELIERVFGVRMFSHYGLSEKAVLAAECEHSTNYHVFPQYCVAEIVENGQPVQPGESGDVVGTSLLNYSMPFIRYQTGDVGSFSKSVCQCNRPHRIFEKLEGKGARETPIVKSDGTTFTLTSFYYTMHGESLDNVLRIQFYQEEPGILEIRVLPTEDFDNKDEDMILGEVESKCDEGLKAKIVRDINLTQSGKQQLFIQNIDN